MSEPTNMSEFASLPEWNDDDAGSPPPGNSAVLVLLSRLSAIVPVIIAMAIAGCLGVWFLSDPPLASKSRSQGGDSFLRSIMPLGDGGRQYTDQLHRQAEDNNEYLRNLQSDIDSRMNSGWRPGN